MTARRPPSCPRCGSAGLPIVWGLITPDGLEELERRGQAVVFGGCCVTPDDPTHECAACAYRWRVEAEVPKR